MSGYPSYIARGRRRARPTLVGRAREIAALQDEEFLLTVRLEAIRTRLASILPEKDRRTYGFENWGIGNLTPEQLRDYEVSITLPGAA